MIIDKTLLTLFSGGRYVTKSIFISQETSFLHFFFRQVDNRPFTNVWFSIKRLWIIGIRVTHFVILKPLCGWEQKCNKRSNHMEWLITQSTRRCTQTIMLARTVLVLCLAGEFVTTFGNKEHTSLMFWACFKTKMTLFFLSILLSPNYTKLSSRVFLY